MFLGYEIIEDGDRRKFRFIVFYIKFFVVVTLDYLKYFSKYADVI